MLRLRQTVRVGTRVVVDAAGKIWTAPNTLAGLLLGGFALLFGARIALAHNAIVFHAVPLVRRAFVLGNVIINPMADLDWRCATYESVARRKRDPLCALETVHLGKHEEAHTWQYQVLGPFFLPVYALTMLLPSPTPFERAADVYAQTGRGWWPSFNPGTKADAPPTRAPGAPPKRPI
jgi:hypothetical protein